MSKDDWYFAVSTILALISILGIDWKLVRGNVAMSNKNRQRFLLAVIAASLVSNVIGWRAIHEIRERIPYADFQSSNLAMGAITLYGGGYFEAGQWHSHMHVDGNAILSYKDNYRVIGIAFHASGAVDMKDIDSLNKTGPHDIAAGDIPMTIDFDSKFLDEMSHGVRGTNYTALLIPNTVEPSQFSTIRQAESMGAIIIGRASGPP